MPEDERQIVPRPDNKYCPSCGAVYEEGEKFCSQCGANLSKTEKKEESKPEDPEAKKKKRKKKIIILVVILAILLIAGGAVAWSYYNRQNKTNKEFENQVNSMWSEVVDRSNTFKDDLQTPSSVKDITQVSDESIEIERISRNKISQVDNLETPKGYEDSVAKFKTALDKYAQYQAKLREDILNKDISKIKVSQDFNDVQKYADYVKDALQNFYDASSYVKLKLSNDVFDLSHLRDYVSKQQGSAQSAAEKQAQEQAAAQQAANKQAAEKTSTDFMNTLPNAYSAADKWVQAQTIADKYWLTAALSNFTSDYKFYFDAGSPVNYNGGQVLSSEKVSDTKYNISSEEKEKTVPGGSVNKFLSYFIVEKEGSAGWFITSHGRR